MPARLGVLECSFGGFVGFFIVSRDPPPPGEHAPLKNSPLRSCLSGALFGLQTAKMASRTASKGAKLTQRRPKMAQDGSRGPQDGIKTAQEGPKTAQDGPRELQEALEESPRRQKTLIFLRFLKVFQGFACLGLRPPKTAREACKIAPRQPKRPSKGPEVIPT